MANHVEFDFSEYKAFISRLRQAASGDFKKEILKWLERMGFDFLRIVQDEIMRLEVMDTRLLLESFQAGNYENLWELSEGDLTLEVGSTVDYAAYVNDGHFTTPAGVESRFVPGYWVGERFIYDPSPETKGGMILKRKWVEGKHYWDSAVRIIEKMFPDLVETMLQEWIDSYFGDFM